ncbi:peroxide stress protein YaaA [Rhodovulum tesquicola]|uniref:peroxide stress protein YaaA n=1 Tax=Rhodovulum tesquicola TaxID=540254 RepID=UPI002097F48F|nr:peroxide stress protein YaaA [Rhodovulum tesquicola]MCO8143879.1 peroxide stress protein YaaA [Rhodovulum tesquicola]
MLVVISPAKRLDPAPVGGINPTAPAFQEDAVHLAAVASALSPAELTKLMHISDKLARLNADRFRDFAAAPQPEAVKPAILMFAGDTYAGFEAASLDADDLRVAQDRLRILSGLYGLLRPLDAIRPHRLEMGSRLRTDRGETLYAYWGDRLARALNEAAQAAGTDILVNCASQEYFGAVDIGALRLRVITPVFLEDRPGGPKIVSFFAKKARGAMARFVVERRLTDPEALLEFDTGGYRHIPDLSEPDRPVFLRGEVDA